MSARPIFTSIAAVILGAAALLVALDDGAREALRALVAAAPQRAEPYACPMEEDAEIRSDAPGRCPKCGMNLVPLSETAHGSHRLTAPGSEGSTRYYCPMHPSYVSDRPGDCPICNMSLVPVDDGHDATISSVEGRASVTIPPERRQLIGVTMGKVERRTIAKTIRAVGLVDYDERRLAAVSLKVGGWIEDLNVSATGQIVRRGDPLFSIYSPELLEAQQSFLVARAAAGTGSSAAGSLKSARERLVLFDLDGDQIREIEERGSVERVITIRSKADGIVTRRSVVRGAYVPPGADLYEISDISTVWILADVYEYEIADVARGNEARIRLSTLPAEDFTGHVAYVYPYLNESTRTVRVRIEVENPDGRLKPGMYATVSIDRDLGEKLVVDEAAVLDTGERQIVFVDLGEGRFEPREIVVGQRTNGFAVVEKGLDEGETVVTSGNFLVDSESRLKAALLQGAQGGGHRH